MSKKANFSLAGIIVFPFFIFLAFQNCSPKGFSTASSSSTGTSTPLLGAAPGGAPVLVSAVSRKSHNLVSFDLPVVTSRLITDSLITVEPRLDLGTGHTIIAKFDRPVVSVLSALVVDATNQKVGEARAILSTTDPTEVGVILTKVSNKMRVRIILSGINGADYSSSLVIGFLSGDINGSGLVDAADVELANAAMGAVLSTSNFKSDINLNGATSVEDRESVRSRLALGLIFAVPAAPAGVVCEPILNYNSCESGALAVAAMQTSVGLNNLTCQSYCASQLLAQANGDYCCMYTPPEATANNQSLCAVTGLTKVASAGAFPKSAASCSRRSGGALNCAATTRSIVSIANNAGTTVSCDATLSLTAASAVPVVAFPVTNNGSYSLICQTDGTWSNAPSTATCPPPADALCPAITRTVTSAQNILGVSRNCDFSLPASSSNNTPIMATAPTLGTSYTLVCQANGTWATNPTASSCPAPDVATANIAVPAAFYTKLSDSPAFNLMKASQNYINFKNYVPQYPLYSDDATKRRFIYLPTNTKIDTTSPDEWQYPMGTIFYKEFSIDGKKIETRVWEKTAMAQGLSSWRSSVYVWKIPDATGEQKDADLLTIDDFYTKPVAERQLYQAGQIEAKYKMVRLAQCTTCHKGSNDSALGFNYLQLSNSSLSFNIQKIAALNYFTMAPLVEDTIKGSQKARDAMGYMQSNCATCHSPRGNSALPNYKHTSSTVLYEGETILVTNNARLSTQLPLITFGDLANSLIHKRLSNRTMPGVLPIKVDTQGVKLLEDWILEPQVPILSLPAQTPQVSFELGGIGLENSYTQAQSFNFKVLVNRAPTTDLVVDLRPGKLGDTALSDIDYTLASSVTIKAGETSATFQMVIIKDLPEEVYPAPTGGNTLTYKSFYIGMKPSLSNSYDISGAGEFNVAVWKTATMPVLQPLQISFEISAIGVGNSYVENISYTFKVLANRAPTTDLVVELQPGKLGDTALNNTDYSLASSVTIKAGETSATFQIVIIKDLPQEVYPAPLAGNTYSSKYFHVVMKPSVNSSFTILGGGEINLGISKTATQVRAVLKNKAKFALYRIDNRNTAHRNSELTNISKFRQLSLINENTVDKL